MTDIDKINEQKSKGSSGKENRLDHAKNPTIRMRSKERLDKGERTRRRSEVRKSQENNIPNDNEALKNENIVDEGHVSKEEASQQNSIISNEITNDSGYETDSSAQEASSFKSNTQSLLETLSASVADNIQSSLEKRKEERQQKRQNRRLERHQKRQERLQQQATSDFDLSSGEGLSSFLKSKYDNTEIERDSDVSEMISNEETTILEKDFGDKTVTFVDQEEVTKALDTENNEAPNLSEQSIGVVESALDRIRRVMKQNMPEILQKTRQNQEALENLSNEANSIQARLKEKKELILKFQKTLQQHGIDVSESFSDMVFPVTNPKYLQDINKLIERSNLPLRSGKETQKIRAILDIDAASKVGLAFGGKRIIHKTSDIIAPFEEIAASLMQDRKRDREGRKKGDEARTIIMANQQTHDANGWRVEHDKNGWRV